MNGCKVLIAAELATKSLLQHEFQQLTFIPLKGYRIRYSRKKSLLPFVIMAQIPRLLFNIYKEHYWLKKIVKNFGVDAILSDNRFGLSHSRIPSIYITHQLLIKTGTRLTEKIAQIIHYWFIKKYTICWIPDFEGSQNIAGALSHPAALPSNAKYIGCLSRFVKKEHKIKYNLLILVSGPEPQRSIFESLLLSQLQTYTGDVLLVRGLPGDASGIAVPNANKGIVIKNHLDAGQLNDAMEQAELVISRSGYTTVMDLIKLRQKAILVPTPGQTEQEYLANHLMQQQIFYTEPQEGFVITGAMKKAATFPFKVQSMDMEQYKPIVSQFVESL